MSRPVWNGNLPPIKILVRYLNELGSLGDYKYVLTAWEVSFNSTLNRVNKKVILTMGKKNMGGWTGEWREKEMKI